VSAALSDAAVLKFALAGCNAAEVAAYSGTTEQVAQARIDRALKLYANPRPVLHLPERAA
jgi:hypothetical protein